MCETCNPLCGGCRPAQLKVLVCSVCGKGMLVTRDECLFQLKRPHRQSKMVEGMFAGEEPGTLVCGNCGADIMDVLQEKVVPLECSYSGIVCGYPCGRRVKVRQEGEPRCATQVPLGKCPPVR